MNAIEAARHIGRCFDEDAIPYAIGGALALGVWGVPRATIDVDVSAFVRRDELDRVLDLLERAGVIVARGQAAKGVARIGLVRGQLGRVVVDAFVSEHPQYAAMRERIRRVVDPTGWSGADLESLFAGRPDLDRGYIRHWLVQMVPAGHPRITMLADLERRF
jgi:hypothetical protein